MKKRITWDYETEHQSRATQAFQELKMGDLDHVDYTYTRGELEEARHAPVLGSWSDSVCFAPTHPSLS